MELIDVTENVLKPSEEEPLFDINEDIRNYYKERIIRARMLLEEGETANEIALECSLPMRMVRRIERGDEIREVFTEGERNE